MSLQGNLESFSGELGSRLENPPAQSQLVHRIGDYYSFYGSMLHCLTRKGQFPLTTAVPLVRDIGSALGESLVSSDKGRIWLNLSEAENWILGLLRSWATVGEVLTFYQERLINEGFLRTAREDRSVHELARLLDYRPGPAVAGSAELSFNSTDVDGLPRDLWLASGSPVEGVPLEGATAQSFETSGELLARTEWNQLADVDPPTLPLPQDLDQGALRLSLASQTGLPGVGDGILIRGLQGGQERLFYRPVAAIAEPAITDPKPVGPPGKDLVWTEPLALEPPALPLSEVEAYALRQDLRLFGYGAPMWIEQPLDVRRRFRDLEGGLRLLDEGSWHAAHLGLPTAPIRCMTYDDQGQLHAGTSGQGIWRLAPDGELWLGPSRGLEQGDICALTTTPEGLLLAGTATGEIYRSTDGGDVWTRLTGRALGRARWTLVRRSKRLDNLPPTPVRTLLSIDHGEETMLFAGTDSGIYRSTDLANTWMPANRGLPGVDSTSGETTTAVSSLLANQVTGDLFAATSAGVFCSGDRGGRWQAINLGLPGMDLFSELIPQGICDLALHFDRRRRISTLFAGTSEGIYRSRDRGNSWQLASEGLSTDGELPEVRCLALELNPVTVTTRLFAATADGVWCSVDEGDSWQPASQWALPGSRTLAASKTRRPVAAAAPFGGFAEEEWPGFSLSRGRIDLEREMPGLAAAGWVVLVPDADHPQPPPVGIYPIREVTVVRRRDFTLDAKISRIGVEPDPALQRYDLRRTRVLLQAEPLTLMAHHRIDPRQTLIALRAALTRMPSDRRVVATARRSHPLLGLDDAVATQPPARAERDTFLSTTAAQLLSSLETSQRAGALSLATEVTASTGPGAPVSVINDSLRIFGNIAEATEGVTIHREILGDGDASQNLQQFHLVEPPAFLRGSPRPRSTVEIQVGNQLWTEVPRLLEQPADSRVYELRRDHTGHAAVVFGDGIHGARLPTGRGNVVATYRFGTTRRPIPADSVRLMHSRPLGLAAVTNPRPGIPGAAAEPQDQIRLRAPRSVLTFDRIVSLQDYEDFVLGYPGVLKARARRLPAAGHHLIQVTLATADTRHRPPEGSLFTQELLESIEQIRASYEPVALSAFSRVGLYVAAKILLHRGLLWAEVKPHLEAALAARFSFERSDFGRPVSPSQAIRALQEVEGVIAVDLDSFHRVNEVAPTEEARAKQPREITPRDASWDSATRQPRPAELVYLERCDLWPVKHDLATPVGESIVDAADDSPEVIET